MIDKLREYFECREGDDFEVRYLGDGKFAIDKRDLSRGALIATLKLLHDGKTKIEVNPTTLLWTTFRVYELNN